MSDSDLWNEDVARAYDTPGEGRFAPEVIGPTVQRLRALAGDGRALEFAVGTGRVAVPLLRAGVPVCGIELSEAMICELRRKVTVEELPVIRGDMVSVRAPGSFSLVFLVYNTITNLLTPDAQVECFRNAARNLESGGRFVVELFVPDLRSMPPGRDAAVFARSEGYLGVDRYDPAEQRLVSHHFRFSEGTEATVHRSPHRYIWPAELDLMARLAGFVLESRHADWSGAPFTADSRDHVSVYRLTGA